MTPRRGSAGKSGIWRGLLRTAVGLQLVTLLACGRGEAPIWNVLVIVPDTLRADHVSINGYARATTPRLDALAREGANFTQAITAAPRTWQSFSSILTGLYPPRHGVRYIYDHPIRPDTLTLGKAFGELGYATAAFDDIPFVKRMTGGIGFDLFWVGEPRKDRRNPDAIVIERAFRWMSQSREDPFFLFMRLGGTHWPYDRCTGQEDWMPCEPHVHAFNRGSFGVKPAGEGEGVVLVRPDAFRRLIWTVDPDEATRAHRIEHYDAEVRTVDFVIGELLAGLRAAGLLETTIIAVTSDHGESFGEHGYLQHGPRLDDPVMRVPLIVRLPAGHPARRAGISIDAQVRLVDLFPTLIDAVGASPPADLDGRSLLPLLRGEPDEPRWAYGEAGRSFMDVDPERFFPGVEGKRRMIRTAGWKLVFIPDPSGGRRLLYDLAADPDERRDVLALRPEIAEELGRHLASVLAREEKAQPERALTPAETERLRSLGYVE